MDQLQTSSGSRTISLVGGVIVLVLIVGGVYVYKSSSRPNTSLTTEADTTVAIPVVTDTTTSTTTETAPSPVDNVNTAAVKIFDVDGKNFSFSPSTLTVNKGDKVKITLRNSDGLHDLVIDEFKVRTPRINAGQTAVVEFTADKTGSFFYYCSVGSHRAMGMQGKLVVQ